MTCGTELVRWNKREITGDEGGAQEGERREDGLRGCNIDGTDAVGRLAKAQAATSLVMSVKGRDGGERQVLETEQRLGKTGCGRYK